MSTGSESWSSAVKENKDKSIDCASEISQGVVTLALRRIVAGFLLFVIVVMIVYPSIASGTLILKTTGTHIRGVDRLRIELNGIRAHLAGSRNNSGWIQIANYTTAMDMMALQNATQVLVDKSIPVGRYDMIVLQILNASATINRTSVKVTVPQRDIVIQVDLAVELFQPSVVLLTVEVNSDRLIEAHTLSLQASAATL